MKQHSLTHYYSILFYYSQIISLVWLGMKFEKKNDFGKLSDFKFRII